VLILWRLARARSSGAQPSHGTEENQAGEVDTGDIFLLIFASKKAQDSPSAALSTSLFLIPFPRDRVLAGLPACENDNCQERLQTKQEHTIPST
jgi:hypothetical protein